MCEMENSVIQTVLKFYKDKGIITDNCVLCFDGIMIPKNLDTEAHLDECVKYVAKKRVWT